MPIIQVLLNTTYTFKTVFEDILVAWENVLDRVNEDLKCLETEHINNMIYKVATIISTLKNNMQHANNFLLIYGCMIQISLILMSSVTRKHIYTYVYTYSLPVA